MKILLIDDIRTKQYVSVERGIDVTHIERTFQSGLEALKNETWDLLVLDHDLASFDEDGKEKTGLDIMNFLEEQVALGNTEVMPKEIYFITANPVGKMNMKYVLERINKMLKGTPK